MFLTFVDNQKDNMEKTLCLPIMFLTFVDNQKDNMEKTLLNIETVTEYDDMLGVETLHP